MGIDQLLQPDFILIGEMAVLPLFQQPLDFRIHLIQRLNIRSETLRDTGIAVLVGGLLESRQFIPSRSSERFERICPVGDDFVAFLFAVRPHCQQAVQPLLRGLPAADKVAFRHAEEGKSRTAVVEGFRSSILPLLRRFLHAFQRFPRLLRAGNIIRQRDGSCDHCGGDGKPYGGRFTQDRKKSLPAATQALGAARFAYLCSKFSKGRGHRAHALRDLPQRQQYRPGSGGISRELNDLLPLGFVHGKELLQKLLRAIDQAADGGIQVVADLLPEQQRSVLEILQLALRGGITLVRFLGQRGVLFPCAGRHILRPREKIRCVDGTEHGIAKAHFLDANLVQHRDGAFALVVQFGQTYDERLERGGGIAVPEALELLPGHSGDLAKILQRLAAGCGSDLHFDQRLGESGAAHLRFDTHGGQCCRKAQYLRFS